MAPQLEPTAHCPNTAIKGTGDRRQEVRLDFFNFRPPAVTSPNTDTAAVQGHTHPIGTALDGDIYSVDLALEVGEVKTEQLACLLNDLIAVGVNLNLHGTDPPLRPRGRVGRTG